MSASPGPPERLGLPLAATGKMGTGEANPSSAGRQVLGQWGLRTDGGSEGPLEQAGGMARALRVSGASGTSVLLSDLEF